MQEIQRERQQERELCALRGDAMCGVPRLPWPGGRSSRAPELQEDPSRLLEGATSP
jgi:hypothetical protein